MMGHGKIFDSFSEEKKILVLRAIVNYLYLKGVETGFLDSVPRLDEIEAMIQASTFVDILRIGAYAKPDTREANYLMCLFARINGISSGSWRYIDVFSILRSIRYVCGEPAAAENILYSLMGVEV